MQQTDFFLHSCKLPSIISTFTYILHVCEFLVMLQGQIFSLYKIQELGSFSFLYDFNWTTLIFFKKEWFERICSKSNSHCTIKLYGRFSFKLLWKYTFNALELLFSSFFRNTWNVDLYWKQVEFIVFGRCFSFWYFLQILSVRKFLPHVHKYLELY